MRECVRGRESMRESFQEGGYVRECEGGNEGREQGRPERVGQGNDGGGDDDAEG